MRLACLGILLATLAVVTVGFAPAAPQQQTTVQGPSLTDVRYRAAHYSRKAH